MPLNRININQIAGFSAKNSVRVASTTNININSAPSSIDGVTLSESDRILLKNQSTGSENGIYVFTAASEPLIRALDADEDSEMLAGSFTFVNEGDNYADTGWILATDNPITLDTTALTFIQFTGGTGGNVVAGNGLIKSGDTIDFVAADNSLTVNTNNVAVKLKTNGGITLDTNGLYLDLDGNTINGTLSNSNGGTNLDTSSSTGIPKITSGTWSVNATTSDLIEGSNLYFTDERAQDAVGNILTDSSTIDFTYNDAGNAITADIKTNSISENYLTTSIAGNGLAGGNGSPLSINTDNSTIEIDTDTLRIKDAGVTYSKIQNVSATSRFLGRKTTGAGVVEELTANDAKTILAITNSDVSGLGTFATLSSIDLTSSNVSNTPTDGQLLIGNSNTSRFNIATLTAGSTKINITNGNGSISLDVNQANLSLSGIGGSLNLSQLNTTGTANSTTYLRGDGSWSTISAGKTVFAQTTNAASTSLLQQDNSKLVLVNNTSWTYDLTVVARTSSGDSAAWAFQGLIKRGANAASTSLVGSFVKTVLAKDTNANAWDVTISADTTNGALDIQVTGAASTTIQWTATVRTAEATL